MTDPLLVALAEYIPRLVQAETETGIGMELQVALEDLFGTDTGVVYRLDAVEGTLTPASRTPATGDRVCLEDVPVEANPWSTVVAEETPHVRDNSEVLLPGGSLGVLRVFDVDTESLTQARLRAGVPIAAAAAVAVDAIHRRATLAEERDQFRNEAEQLQEFANIVSHDLRNPLSVATGHLELACKTGDERHLDAIEGALERIERIIQHTLSLARDGNQIDHATAVDLRQIATRAWSSVPTADATVEIEETRTLHADPDRLQQLLENLLRNAIEHGGNDVNVRIGTHESGFFVADDGPGIPPEMRQRITERGFSSREDGTGFGLYIVREIATAHHWTLEITDSESGGARFEFTTE